MPKTELTVKQAQKRAVNKNVFKPSDFLVGAGFSFILAWYSFSFRHFNLYGDDGNLTRIAFVATLAASIFLVILFYTRKQKVELKPTFAIPFSAVLTVVGTFLLCPFAFLSQFQWLFPYIGAFLAGIGGSWLVLRWGQLFARLPRSEIMMQLALALVLSIIYQLGFILLGENEKLISSIIVLAVPVISAVFLFFIEKARAKKSKNKQSFTKDYKKHADLLRRMTLTAFVMSFLLVFSREVSLLRNAKIISTSAFLFMYLIILVLLMGMLFYIIHAARHGKLQEAVSVTYRVCIIASLVGVFSISTSKTLSYVAFGINGAAFAVLFFTFAFVLLQLSKDYNYSILSCFGRLLASLCFGIAVATILTVFLNFATFSLETLMHIAFASAICLVTAYLFLFNEHSLAEISREAQRNDKGSWQSRCQAVATQYGLSEREYEVMVLLAKGRNASYIQESLCISKSTVSTHRQHIYSKLEIHTQQELLNIIENISSVGGGFTPLSSKAWKE